MLQNFTDYICSLTIQNKKLITQIKKVHPIDWKEIRFNGRKAVIKLHLRYMCTYMSTHILNPFPNNIVGGFGKKSCVTIGVRKPGNTYASPTTMI